MTVDPILTDGADPATILVAIPTLNEATHIGATLDALLDRRSGIEAARVVVADGGSTDETRDIVARAASTYPNLRLIDNPDRLQSAAINRVVEMEAEAHHAILVRADAHARYPPRYVLDVARSLRAHEAAALATVMDSTGESCFQRGAAWAVDTLLGSGGADHRGGTRSGYVDHGHHAGFDLATFRAVGGYDTRFVANEDAELDHRITRRGGRIWLAADIRLGYVMRPGPGALARQYWRYGRGRAQTVRKHRMVPRPRQMIPPIVMSLNAAALVLAPALPALLLIPALYLMVLSVVTIQLLVRHRSICALWAGPALAAMHHAWGAGFLREWIVRARRA